MKHNNLLIVNILGLYFVLNHSKLVNCKIDIIKGKDFDSYEHIASWWCSYGNPCKVVWDITE